MIREFSVENFLSIRDLQVLSFIAKGPDSEVVAKMPPGEFIYKLGILFGPNASGKSNVIKALLQCLCLLTTPKTNAKENIDGYCPFALKKDEPIKFYLSFYADGIRYDYKITYYCNYIRREELFYYPKGVRALFYDRRFVGENLQADITFGSTLSIGAKTQRRIREHTLNNHSVLSVCGKNVFKEDIEPLTKLYSWIMSHYIIVDGQIKTTAIMAKLKETIANPRKHRFYCNMLKKADLNIYDFHPIIEDGTQPDSIHKDTNKENQNSNIINNKLFELPQESFVFENHTDEGDSQFFELPINRISKGSLSYINILDALYDLIIYNKVYFLDGSLENIHPDLLFFYLNVFLFNSTNSQLIITSQQTSLLAQEIIDENRGVVWFVEKNPETAFSEYNRGDTFGLHKNLSLHKSFLIGRLGAKPDLGSFFIEVD